MFIDRDKKPEFGSICIGTDKEIKGSSSDDTYLFVFSNLLNTQGDWLYVCRIEAFSQDRFNQLFEMPKKYFEIVEIKDRKYLAYGRCLVEYPEEVRVLYSREPDF